MFPDAYDDFWAKMSLAYVLKSSPIKSTCGGAVAARDFYLLYAFMGVFVCKLRRSKNVKFCSSALLNELSVLGSIAKVAGVIGLTRPAVSQQLAILEQETGTVLFERSVRGVTLTTAGETLVLQSLKLLEMVREIESDLASAKRTIGGQVRIAGFGSLAMTLIPAVIHELMHKFPDLDLRFDELEPIESLKAAAAKQLDLAFVDDSVSAEALSSMLYFRPVFEDHLSLVMASSHPLAGRDSIELAELAKENWALNRNAQTYRAYLLDACHQAGYVPRVVASCRNMAAALELVRTGYVITVLPALALQSAMADSGFAIAPLRPLMVGASL